MSKAPKILMGLFCGVCWQLAVADEAAQAPAAPAPAGEVAAPAAAPEAAAEAAPAAAPPVAAMPAAVPAPPIAPPAIAAAPAAPAAPEAITPPALPADTGMAPEMHRMSEKMYRQNQMAREEMRLAHKAMRMRVLRNMDENLSRQMAFMKGKIKITPEQENAWSGYVSAVQAQSQSMLMFREKRHEARMGRTEPMNSIERLNSHIEKMSAHLESMKKVAVAAGGLYAVLNAEQQAVADRMFRNRHGKKHHKMHH